MSTGIFFTIEALIYVILLAVIYFKKERLKKYENKIYSILIIIAAFELILELALDYIGPLFQSMATISYTIAKIYCVFLNLWITIFCMYIVVVSLNMKNYGKYIKYAKNAFLFLILAFSLMIFALPISFQYYNSVAYTHGAAVNIVYITSFLYCIIGGICLCLNLKNIRDKRFSPLLIFIVLGGICSYIQYKNPGLLLAVPVHAFITFLMYFTIENPDMQMIDELIKTQNIAQSSTQNKSMFIYDIVQKIKLPLSNIKKTINASDETTNIELLQNDLTNIYNETNKIDFIINSTLDISNVNSEKIKVYEDAYDIKQLIKEINLKYKNLFKDQIEFRINIAENIPETLFGDSMRLKQIISSLLNNSLKYTKTGYIELAVSFILKQDICRLLINVEDSGIGMSIYKTNSVFKNDNSKDIQVEKFEESDLDMPTIKSMVDYLGGTIMLDSKENLGTKITIVLDQKIQKQKQEFVYDNILDDRKKILIVSKNYQSIKEKTEKLFNNANINANYVEYGVYALKRLRAKEKFDTIIINDNIEKLSCEELVDKIRNTEKFNGQLIVVAPEIKEAFYRGKGISDFIKDENKIKDKIEEIIKLSK